MVSTGLSRARRFQAALALHPHPASKVQCARLEFADIDTHNRFSELLTVSCSGEGCKRVLPCRFRVTSHEFVA